jgi:hypothetical protein
MPSADLISRARQAIYTDIARTGRPPTVAALADSCGVAAAEMQSAFRALADAHVIVLQPGTLELCWAPPFSAVRTAFRVHAEGVSWHAPCAWDAFGIPAAIKRDVTIEARCAWSGEPMPIGIRDGQVAGTGLVHLEVPARRFWDDIFYT